MNKQKREEVLQQKKIRGAIYNAMKDFIENGYEIKNKFDYQTYNQEILNKLENLF